VIRRFEGSRLGRGSAPIDRSRAVPATQVAVLERSGGLAARLRAALVGLAVDLRECRTTGELAAALSGGPFPLALIDARGADHDRLAAFKATERFRADVLLVINPPELGGPGPFERELLLESGAGRLLEPADFEDHLGPIVGAMVLRSQERISLAGGVRP
jgi:hypothetical protein